MIKIEKYINYSIIRKLYWDEGKIENSILWFLISPGINVLSNEHIKQLNLFIWKEICILEWKVLRYIVIIKMWI